VAPELVPTLATQLLDPADLAATRRILDQVTVRARELSTEL